MKWSHSNYNHLDSPLLSMVFCPLVNPKAENKTANVVLPDLVHRLYQSMIFYGALINVI
jgi:hypothetical protein